MKASIHILLIFTFIAIMQGCKSDPCTDVACENGTCIEGRCVCTPGFEGSICQTNARLKFLGAWTAGDICNSGATVYDVEVVEGEGISGILFKNLHQTGPEASAVVEGNEFEIPLQAFGNWTIQGSGRLDTATTTLSLDYLLDFGNGLTDACLATLEPR